MTTFSRLVLLALVGIVIHHPSAAGAQSRTSSALRGTVRIADGGSLASASVVFRNARTGIERTGVTNPEGRYLFLQLQPGGPYTVTVRALGFTEQTVEGVQLQVGETRTLDFALTPQAIEVEGVAVAVDRSSIFNPTQVGPATRISERVVESLPLPSRNIMELATLSPLVKMTDDGGFSVAGQNSRYNSILIDGVMNKDMFGLTAGGVPGGQAGGKLIPLDAVAQYEVLVAPFDVRQSGFTGGVLNAITRTGTNEWWGRSMAVGRTEQLTGNLALPTGTVDASGVERSLLGLSLGGPIVRDRAHFFFSGEWERRSQQPSGFNALREPASLTRVTDETVAAITDYLAGLGLNAGEAGPYPMQTRLGNVFARIDWTINDRHRLIARNIYAGATTEDTPNRGIFDAYEFSSNTSERRAMSNSTSIQLFSDFSNGSANEFTIQTQVSNDRTTPAVDYPTIEIETLGTTDGAPVAREVRLGSDFFSQANDLEQRVVRATNVFTRVNGDTNQIFGATLAHYDFKNTFLPGAAGAYSYASLTDLMAGAPERYQRQELIAGTDPEVGFEVIEAGLFAQAQIDAGDGLHMRFGLRADVPFVLGSGSRPDLPDDFGSSSGRPGVNSDVLSEFGYNTSKLPSGRLLLSPRWGFNWQSEARRRTQVRGGAGLFVGQIPFAWLANAYHNDGLRSRTLRCSGRHTDDPAPPTAVPATTLPEAPSGCRNGQFISERNVVVFSEDFEYPQDLKFSVVVDQEITEGLTFSVGALFNKAINQVVLEELNLGGGARVGNVAPFGGFDRRYFGSASADGFEPSRTLQGYQQILLAKNASEDWGASLTLELSGNLTSRVGMQAGYTLAGAWDRMSLVATDMVTNYGLTPTEYDPNRPVLRTSNFDRPHKVVLSLFGAPIPGLDDTEISLLYTGQSGVPFSYVYAGDINGDGYAGPGASFDRYNDLIYVPETASELPMSIASRAILEAALKSDPCLSKYRGQIMPRNGCRSPWQNRLDVRVSQAIRRGDGLEIRLEADVLNFLNLLNSDWGRVETVRSVVPVIKPVGRAESQNGIGDLLTRWDGAILPTDGPARAADPWSVATPDSQWQAQFGLRVTFGGG